MKDLNNNNEIKGYSLHNGKPPGLHECSKCLKMLDNSHFKYYKHRVNKKGYLLRSNALCSECVKITNKERKTTLDKATKNNEIPPKPLPGDICPNCKRKVGF